MLIIIKTSKSIFIIEVKRKSKEKRNQTISLSLSLSPISLLSFSILTFLPAYNAPSLSLPIIFLHKQQQYPLLYHTRMTLHQLTSSIKKEQIHHKEEGISNKDFSLISPHCLDVSPPKTTTTWSYIHRSSSTNHHPSAIKPPPSWTRAPPQTSKTNQIKTVRN